MSTTALFVDLLIVGIQVATWMVLLFLTLCGVDWIDLGRAKEWQTTISVMLLSVVYPTGVFVDHLADSLLSGWRRRIRDIYVKDKSRTVMDLLMTAKDDKLSTYYDYLRIRIRISRSSAFNFALIAFLFPIFAATRLEDWRGVSTWFLALVVAIASAVIAGLALYTWVGLTHGFYEKLIHGLAIVAELRLKSADQDISPSGNDAGSHSR